MEHPSDASPAVALLRLLGPGGPGGTAVQGALSDWPSIAAVAFRSGLAPLLYRRIAGSPGPDAPPSAILAPLRSAYLHTLGVNLRAREQIAEIVAALAAGGVPSVLLKGAHLAHGVYEDPGTRPMSDLDLLVSPGRIAEAAALLRPLGYAPLTRYTLASELAHRAHLPPFEAPDGLPLELHWRLLRPTEPYRPDTTALIERARPLAALGPSAFALDPADAFLHLALHAIAKDRLCGALRTIVDLSLLIGASRGDASWAASARRAREAGAARVHDLALALLAALAPDGAHHPPPTGFAEAAPEPDVLDLALALILAPPPVELAGEITPNLARVFAGSPRAAARLIVARIFPTRSEMGALDPEPAGAAARLLRYPRRWAMLLSRHGPAAWRLLLGSGARRESVRSVEQGRKLAAWCAGAATPHHAPPGQAPTGTGGGLPSGLPGAPPGGAP